MRNYHWRMLRIILIELEKENLFKLFVGPYLGPSQFGPT